MVKEMSGIALLLPLVILVIIIIVFNMSKWIQKFYGWLQDIEFKFKDTMIVFAVILVTMAIFGIYLLTGPWW